MNSTSERNSVQIELKEISDFKMEVDEEPSDVEGEQEQLISLPSFLHVPDPILEIPEFCLPQLKDPLMVIKEEPTDLSDKNCVCCYCSFFTYNDSDLLRHIEQEHKDISPTYICPICSFKTSKLVEWITHKGTCENMVIKKGIDEAELERENGNEKPVELTKSSSSETNSERRPLIKVKSEFNINPSEGNNNPDSIEESKLVINCYQSEKITFSRNKKSLRNLLKPLEENNCRVSIRKKRSRPKLFSKNDENDVRGHTFSQISKQIAPIPEKLDIMRDDVLELIKVILKEHNETDHNYCTVNLFQKFDLMKQDRSKLIRTYFHLRSKLLKSDAGDIKIQPERKGAHRLLQHIQHVLQYRSSKNRIGNIFIKPADLKINVDSFYAEKESSNANNQSSKIKFLQVPTNAKSVHLSEIKSLQKPLNLNNIEFSNDRIFPMKRLKKKLEKSVQELKDSSSVAVIKKIRKTKKKAVNLEENGFIKKRRKIRKDSGYMEENESKPKILPLSIEPTPLPSSSGPSPSEGSSSKSIIKQTSEELIHTCKKRKRKKRSTYWSKYKRVVNKNCAACMEQNSKCE